jgi:tetratricopeptide (TPR) repeat protein
LRVAKDVERSGSRWIVPVAAAVLGVAALGFWLVRARPAADADQVWQDAESDFRAGRHEVAEASIARLETLRPPTTLDWFLKAQVAMVHQREDEAIADLAKVPDHDPMGAQARLLAGQIELRRRHAGAAERSLIAATKLDPTLVQAHRELVYIYGMLLRRRELRAEFLTLSEISTLTFENVFHWCLTRNTIWEPGELTRELNDYVKADPTDRWSRLALAENLRQIGRRNEAEQVLSVVAADDPDALPVRVHLALDRGDDEAAEALLKQGPPDHAELARLRGRFALAHRDGAAAVLHFRKAYAAEPDHRDSVVGLGQALTLIGKYEEAAPFIAEARDIDALGALVQRAATVSVSVRPTATDAERQDPALLHALGAACEKVRRLPEARAWYRLAILANPLDSEAQKALYRLYSSEKPGTVEAPKAAGSAADQQP